jgi:hypothetical protein
MRMLDLYATQPCGFQGRSGSALVVTSPLCMPSHCGVASRIVFEQHMEEGAHEIVAATSKVVSLKTQPYKFGKADQSKFQVCGALSTAQG